ncbi:RSE1 (YML049C) [Zygosaccharomyces parabailii]|nr:RSE1 (YML049C) [Zygosaccharomyces parabailii]
MFVDSSELNLYHLTLQRQSNYVHSCIGHFVDGNEEENTTALTNGKIRPKKHLQLCIATETHLELYDVSEGSLKKLALVPVFAIVAAIETLHLENTVCSFLAITSDSGNLTLAKFVRVSDEKVVLKTLLNQPLTRSGLRRLSPISYLQVDLHGRCLFLSAIERNILCFVANQVGQDGICLQDPLEALVPHSLTLDTTVCDVSYDNPCFASLEIRGNHYLVFYVLDLGLNHIVKKADYKLNDTANFLMGLPALSKYHIACHIETDGGGDQVEYDETNPFVLIGFENFLVIKDLQGYFDIKVLIPRRNGKPGPTIIICYAIQTLKKDFFVLLQSNWGDLFKLKIIPDKKNFNRPTATISYFDTIPQASNLHIFKNGYLFATSELNDNYLFQFESLGDDEPLLGSSFEPSVNLQNLSLVEIQKNLNPLSSSQVVNAAPLTFTMSSLNKARFLTNGVNFDTTISTQLPAGADDIWTIKFPTDEYHRLLFLSYSKSTMILKTEEGTMEQLPPDESSFKVKADKTVFVGIMGNKSVIQVCENEMRQITTPSQSNQFERKLEWYPPAGIRVIAAASTRSQLVIALSNGEVAYFEMDTESGSDSLHELQNRIEFNEDITGVAMLPGLRSDFLAVGNKESTIKILSLKKSDVDDFLEVVSIQALMAPVSDLKLIRIQRELQLHVGLENGVYLRSKLNGLDGQLYDVKRKFLGPKRVTLSLIPNVSLTATSKDEESDEDESDGEGQDTLDSEHFKENTRQLKPCVILHSTKTWVCYENDILFHVRPILLSNDNALIKVSDFAAENIKTNGCCALTSSHNLVIGKILDFISKDKWFHVEEVDLNEISNDESRFGQEDEEDLERVPKRLYDACKVITFGDSKDLTLYIENAVDDEHVRVSLARAHHFFTLTNNTQKFQILQKMKAVTAVITKFTTSSHYLVVSASDNKLYTFVLTFKRVPNGAGTFELELIHTTQVEDRVHAMIEFKKKLLVPVFGSLILYSLGKKQLLKRSISQTTAFITKITALSNWEDQRIAVGDNRESVTLFCFDDSKNVFVAIADDIVKRYVTCLAFLDQSTVIGGDKFGNIWTLRLPHAYEKLIKTNFPRALDSLQQYRGLKRKAPNAMDCPFKWTILNHFFVNDIPMHIQKIKSVQLSDRPSIIYCGLQGTIGCLIPLLTKQEIMYMKDLEVVMRDADDIFSLDQDTQNTSNMEVTEDNYAFGDDTPKTGDHARTQIPEGAYSIVGRDHLKYRSYYAPVRNVIDGDLCETFVNMSVTEQMSLCKQLTNLKPEDVINQVNEIRTNYI